MPEGEMGKCHVQCSLFVTRSNDIRKIKFYAFLSDLHV